MFIEGISRLLEVSDEFQVIQAVIDGGLLECLGPNWHFGHRHRHRHRHRLPNLAAFLSPHSYHHRLVSTALSAPGFLSLLYLLSYLMITSEFNEFTAEILIAYTSVMSGLCRNLRCHLEIPTHHHDVQLSSYFPRFPMPVVTTKK